MCSGKSISCSAGSFLCFLQIIIVLLQQTHAVTNNKQAYCAPSSCGKITNISHPFRLKDDPATCGDPRYELACENNRTVLSLYSGKYYVEVINYKNFTIRLVDPAIQEADNCSSILTPRYFLYTSNFSDSYTHNDTADPYQTTQWRIIDGPTIQDLVKLQMFQHVIYMNCSNPVTDDPVYADTAPCSINRDSKGHVYAIAGDLRVGNLKDDCHVEVVAAISFSGFNYSYGGYNWDMPDQNFSNTQIHRMLVYGFEVSWMGQPCEELCGSKRCYLSEPTWSLDCDYWADHCVTPLGFHVRCGHFGTESGYLDTDDMTKTLTRTPSELRIFVEDVMYGIAKGLLQVIGVTIYDASEGISESQLGIEIGRITGKYVLSSYIILRFLSGFIVFLAKMIYICRTRHTSMYENIEAFLQGNSLMPIRYSYKEIKKMTRGFKDKLGEGGYGSVYKGKLRSGPLVAVKMLGKPKSTTGQEFINEVATIGRIHHTNVVRLIGFCVESSKRALVYEFMPNGSLDRYVSFTEDGNGTSSLTYQQMYEISLGVARGIAYLHQGCDMQILHFDIKPHNILLDKDFIPKVSDFGLAKLYPIDNSIVTLTAARGTIGYMAPELFYKNIGGVSYKADVYSFGMLLMEMANRRRNLNPHADHSSQIFFPLWIYNQLSEEREIQMEEATDGEKNNVKKMFIVSLWCIQLNPSDRPSMNKVIEMLEGDIENIKMPPKPSLYPADEMIQDLVINSDKSLSDDAASSISFLEDTIEDSLLKYSS